MFREFLQPAYRQIMNELRKHGCVLSIVDSINLIQDFPIIGEEYVKIEFKTPSSMVPASYLLRVNKVKDKQVFPNNKAVTYNLECVSSEVFRNASTLVSKQLNDSVSSGIRDLVTNDLGTQKSLKVEETKGIDKVLVTRMTPFKAVDFLRRRAISKKYASSAFVFFENRNGYQFTTIEKLIDEGTKYISESDRIFFYDSASNNMDMSNVTLRNIIAYNQVTFADTLSKVQNGGLNNQVLRFDLISGDVKILNTTINEVQDKFKSSDDKSSSMNTSGFSRNHGKTTTVTNFVPFSSDRDESLIPEKISISQTFTQQLVQNIVQIFVYGDSDLTIGDMITCNFPETVGMSKDPAMARLDSGNYLVSKVRHMISLGDRPQHTMSMELLKGNFLEAS